jgi:FkbM family methyltransferase
MLAEICGEKLMNFSGISGRTFIGKALRFPLSLIPSGTQMPILQGPLHGKRWIVGASNHGCWLGSYEYAKQKAFSAAIKRGDVVYDLGANVGFYSLLASVLVGPEGQIFSFEPALRNLTFLRKHIELNGVKNCSVRDVAVSCSDGTAKFDLGPNSSMGHLTADSPDALSVRTIALDSLVASGQIPPPNVIKCDIEGGEYDALRGASETLSKHSPMIFLATHGPEVHERCCRLLTDIRYVLTSLDDLPLNLTSEVLATRQQR